jgi:nitrogenase molybdenum-iron protein alpha/beta subunit
LPTVSKAQWINKFKERGYYILSVILDTKIETCINRVNVKRGESYSKDYVKGHYDNFHQMLRSIFKIKAAISEISIDANDKQPYEIGDEILKHLGRVNYVCSDRTSSLQILLILSLLQ